MYLDGAFLDSCPFDGNDRIDKKQKRCLRCGGEVRSKWYCAACKSPQTFTVLDGKFGCWNDNCPKKVFSSFQELYESL